MNERAFELRLRVCNTGSVIKQVGHSSVSNIDTFLFIITSMQSNFRERDRNISQMHRSTVRARTTISLALQDLQSWRFWTNEHLLFICTSRTRKAPAVCTCFGLSVMLMFLLFWEEGLEHHFLRIFLRRTFMMKSKERMNRIGFPTNFSFVWSSSSFSFTIDFSESSWSENSDVLDILLWWLHCSSYLLCLVRSFYGKSK